MTRPAPAVIDSYPLSPTQAGMLYHAVSAARSGVDIEQVVLTLREALDESAFVQAWNAVVQRHTILRTCFRWEGVEEFQQDVVATAEMPVTCVDWRQTPPDQTAARLAAHLAADRQEDFDLTRAPAMRLFVARVGAEAYTVVWTFHHALLDGRSFPVLLREVFDIYAASRAGTSPVLDEPRPYREYIDGLRSRDASGAEAFWRARLRGVRAATPFNVDQSVAASDEAASDALGGVAETRLSRAATDALRSRADALGVTLNTMLQGAWAWLLHRYSGEADVVFGTTRAGRIDSEAGERVGLFINTLPMRVSCDGDTDLESWLRALRAQQVEMRPFAHTPLVQVQSWSAVERGRPLFESLVVYDHASLGARMRALGGRWATRDVEYIGQTNYPLTVVAYGDAEMLVRIEYARRRFSDDSVTRMLGHLTTLLEGLGRGDVRLLRELEMVPAAERAALAARRREAPSYPTGLALHEMFERQVERRPDAIALTAFGANGERSDLSYAELNRRANRVAHRLRAMGVVPNQLVGLRTDRNAELVVGLLAILKAGGAYLPLDPVYPRDRIAFMLEDSRAAVVLTQSNLEAELAHVNAQLVCLDALEDTFPSADANLGVTSRPNDLAYVIYTSGSTGTPKGVLITHHNVARLFAATDHWFRFDEHDVWTLFHSYSFDFSVWELWGALLYGGRLVTVSLDTSRSTDAFRELLVGEQVTVLNQTPTAFRQLMAADAAQPGTRYALRYVIFGGEALELQSLKGWFERHGDTAPRLINMYGITETTVHVTYRPISRADVEAGAGSVIGEPIPDLTIYLLDRYGDPAPIGVPAEIHVAGAGVALGYLNRPDLTAARFVRDPFDSAPDARMYRSGDLARRLENGDLEYLGRIDQQVKIRGFRIELGEIEAAIAQHPLVRQVAVVAREDAPGDKRLAAYLVGPDPSPQVVDELRHAMRAKMPDYMLPAHFVWLDALPLTQNGKLDRTALPAPIVQRADTTRPCVPPRNATEAALAAVWQAVLRVDRVGIDDHFFELGGDSILSIQVLARCRQQGLHFTPKDLFTRPTIAQLADVVRVVSAPAATPATASSGVVPLTPIQQWFFEQQFADAHYWNQAFVFEVPAGINLAALETALGGLVARHDALRLRYHQDERGHWSQQYASDARSLPLDRVDVSSVAAEARGAAVTAAAAAAQATFDLGQGPLARAVHFDFGPADRGRLLLAIHHLVVDGVSWRVLREDLEALFLTATGAAAPSMPDLTTSVQAWSHALTAYAASAEAQRALAHWRALDTDPGWRWPHHVAGQAPCAATGSLSTRLSREETRALLQRVPAVFHTQINDALLTALGRALQRHTGQDRVRIDLEGHGREHIADGLDVSRTVGWFTTLFPVDLQLAGAADAVETLLAVKAQLQQVPDRGLTFGLLRYLSSDPAVRESLARMAPSPVLFNYLGQFDAVVAGSTMFGFAAESSGPWRSPRAHRSHPVEVVAVVRDGQLEVTWHHDADAAHVASMASLADDMMAGLRELVTNAEPSHRHAASSAATALASVDASTAAILTTRYPRLEAVYPLTPMQRLFFAMETSAANLGFEQWHFRLDGALDQATLRRAIEAVVDRHSILRSAFLALGGAAPVQVVSAEATLPWSVEDWRGLGQTAQDERLRVWLASDARTAFDLSQAPLMRVALLRVADDVHHLVWSTHHLYIDGWSWPIVFRDVSRAYAALDADQPLWSERAPGYQTYVEWLAGAPSSENFWKRHLAGVSGPTPLQLTSPAVAAGAVASNDAFAEVQLRLPADTTDALVAFARRVRMTPSAAFNAAWALVLAHYSDAPSVVFGAAFSGRPPELEGIESMVGPCVNNVPIRVHIDPEATLATWLADVQQRQFEVAQHQYSPLEEIQRWAGIEWRHRLFDSLVVFQNYQVDADARTMGTTVRSTLLSAPEATNYPLTLTVSTGPELRVRMTYKPSVLARPDVEQMASDLRMVLSAMVSGPATVGDLVRPLAPASRGQAQRHAAVRATARQREYAAPSTGAEREIAAVWQELFGVDRVSLDDNFFDMGGHSLLLVRAHARLAAQIRPDLPVVALLQYPTVRSLARYLTGGAEVDRQAAASATVDRALKQREAQQRQRKLAGKHPPA